MMGHHPPTPSFRPVSADNSTAPIVATRRCRRKSLRTRYEHQRFLRIARPYVTSLDVTSGDYPSVTANYKSV